MKKHFVVCLLAIAVAALGISPAISRRLQHQNRRRPHRRHLQPIHQRHGGVCAQGEPQHSGLFRGFRRLGGKPQARSQRRVRFRPLLCRGQRPGIRRQAAPGPRQVRQNPFHGVSIRCPGPAGRAGRQRCQERHGPQGQTRGPGQCRLGRGRQRRALLPPYRPLGQLQADLLGYSAAASAFQDGKIDAFWVLVGYPNRSVIEAAVQVKIALVDVGVDAEKTGFYRCVRLLAGGHSGGDLRQGNARNQELPGFLHPDHQHGPA